MPSEPAWTFVESEAGAGDGDLWLSHHHQLTGWIDFWSARKRAQVRLMVVSKEYLARIAAEIGNEAKHSVIAAALIIPGGAPEAMRAAIDAAVRGGGLDYFAEPSPDSGAS